MLLCDTFRVLDPNGALKCLPYLLFTFLGDILSFSANPESETS